METPKLEWDCNAKRSFEQYKLAGIQKQRGSNSYYTVTANPTGEGEPCSISTLAVVATFPAPPEKEKTEGDILVTVHQTAQGTLGLWTTRKVIFYTTNRADWEWCLRAMGFLVLGDEIPVTDSSEVEPHHDESWYEREMDMEMGRD